MKGGWKNLYALLDTTGKDRGHELTLVDMLISFPFVARNWTGYSRSSVVCSPSGLFISTSSSCRTAEKINIHAGMFDGHNTYTAYVSTRLWFLHWFPSIRIKRPTSSETMEYSRQYMREYLSVAYWPHRCRRAAAYLYRGGFQGWPCIRPACRSLLGTPPAMSSFSLHSTRDPLSK